MGGFEVESPVAVDDRGQMVLPKELRDRAGIRGGNKLASVGRRIKVEEFRSMIKGVLGPLMGDLLPKDERRD